MRSIMFRLRLEIFFLSLIIFLGKLLVGIIKLIIYTGGSAAALAWLGITEIFTGHSIKTKLFLIGLFAAFPVSLLIMPIIFKLLIVLFLGISLLFGAYTMWDDYHADTNKQKSYSGNNNRTTDSFKPKSGIFDGLTPEEAKRKYRQLIKQYHPDNYNGDNSMAQKIISEYNTYCKYAGAK